MKLTLNTIVCMTIDWVEPTQRVAFRAACVRRLFRMRGLYRGIILGVCMAAYISLVADAMNLKRL